MLILKNTLAESGTINPSISSSVALVSGNGTDIFSNPSLADRTKRKAITNYKSWSFQSNAFDWINEHTGERLTGYVQPLELTYLLNECNNSHYH